MPLLNVVLSSGRYRCPAVASQCLHSHAGDNQIHFERRRGNLHSALASQRLRALYILLAYPSWPRLDFEYVGRANLAPDALGSSANLPRI